MFSTSAFISWKPGYNGGLKQTIEIWYRRADSDDHHWKTITRISADVTWYTVYSLEPQIPYLFSLRGVNKAGFGLFSEVFRSETTTLSPNYQKEDKQGKERWEQHYVTILISFKLSWFSERFVCVWGA